MTDAVRDATHAVNDTTMTADEFCRARDALGLSNRAVARMLGEDEKVVRRFADGREPVWASVAAWLRRRAAARLADPPPTFVTRGWDEGAVDAVEAARRRERMRSGLAAIDWSAVDFARAVDRAPQAIRFWLTGTAVPRLSAVEWVERQVAAFAEDPAPRRDAKRRTGIPRGVMQADLDAADMVLAREVERLRSGGDDEGAGRLDRVAALLGRLPEMLRGVGGAPAVESTQIRRSEKPGEVAAPRAVVAPGGVVPVVSEKRERPAQIREAMKLLGLGPGEVAVALGWPGLEPEHVLGLATARVEVPPALGRWFRAMLRLQSRPDEWRKVLASPPPAPPEAELRPLIEALEGETMRPEEFRTILTQLDMDADMLSEAIRWAGFDGRNVRRTFSGQFPVHPSLARWLRDIYAADEKGRAVLFASPPELPPRDEQPWSREMREAAKARKAAEGQGAPAPKPAAAPAVVRPALVAKAAPARVRQESAPDPDALSPLAQQRIRELLGDDEDAY